VKYEWDEEKRKSNIRKHGLDFEDAAEIFEGDTLTVSDDRKDYGEKRFVTIGLCKAVVIVVAHTEKDDLIRIISMRKATKNEENSYFEQVGHKLEADQGDEG
jgi:uncharacterized DUF497 family protein